MLIKQTEKFCVLSKRSSSFTDEKTGQLKSFQYLSGFNAVSGEVFTDVQVSKDSLLSFKDVEENFVYDAEFDKKSVKGEKNAVTTSGVKLIKIFGTLEVKETAKK